MGLPGPRHESDYLSLFRKAFMRSSYEIKKAFPQGHFGSYAGRRWLRTQGDYAGSEVASNSPATQLFYYRSLVVCTSSTSSFACNRL